jgi:hypothetical protein
MSARLVQNPDMRWHASHPILVAAMAVLLGGCGSSTPSVPDDGSCTMQQASVANEGWLHVLEGSTITYAHNPPASGPHYPVWLRYEAFSTAMARGYWVHNLEHGGIVMIYRPDAPAAVIDAMKSAYRNLPDDPLCGQSRALLTPDPLLNGPVAVVAADFVLSGTCVSTATINQFVTTHRGRGPEQICAGGQRP